MALNLDPIYENMVKQFRTVVDDDVFQENFRDAINNTLDKLSFSGDLSTPLAHVAGYSGSVSGLDQDDQSIVSKIVTFELILIGRKHVRGDTAYQEFKTESEEALGDFMIKKSRDDQADVADNLSGEGASIAGLGDRTEAVSTGVDTMNGE